MQIKMEVEALERIKDEESKLFERNKIFFDFNVLIRIKESMVDVSSRCIALALEVSEGCLILFINQLFIWQGQLQSVKKLSDSVWKFLLGHKSW